MNIKTNQYILVCTETNLVHTEVVLVLSARPYWEYQDCGKPQSWYSIPYAGRHAQPSIHDVAYNGNISWCVWIYVFIFSVFQYMTVCTWCILVHTCIIWVCTLIILGWTGLCEKLLGFCKLRHQPSEAKQAWVCWWTCFHIGHVACTCIPSTMAGVHVQDGTSVQGASSKKKSFTSGLELNLFQATCKWKL